MPTASSDSLHQLIRSLDSNEKRYFKMFSERHAGEKKYMLLFDAISKQTEYNEAALKKKFSKQSFVKQFAVAKNYLFNNLVQVLQQYHGAGGDLREQLEEELRKSKLFSRKGLKDLAKKSLQKAESMAIEKERFNTLLEIYEMRRAEYVQYAGPAREEFILRIHELQNDAIRKQQQLIAFSLLWYRFSYIQTRKYNPRNEEDFKEAQELLNSPILYLSDETLSRRSVNYKYQILSGIYSYVGQDQKSFEIARQIFELKERDFAERKISPREIIASLYNLCIRCITIPLLNEVPKYLGKFNQLRLRDIKSKVDAFERYYPFRIDFCMLTGNFETGVESIRMYKKQHHHLGDKMIPNQELIVSWSLLKFYLSFAKYEECISEVNDMMNHPNLKIGNDYEPYLRLINLLCHYELGNTVHLEYIARGTYRFLHRRNHLYGIEKLALSFIREMGESKINDDRNEIYRRYLDQSRELIQNPFEKNALYYFDFISWLESKLQKTTIAKIYATRNKAFSKLLLPPIPEW